jgi:hypothetical protein
MSWTGTPAGAVWPHAVSTLVVGVGAGVAVAELWVGDAWSEVVDVLEQLESNATTQMDAMRARSGVERRQSGLQGLGRAVVLTIVVTVEMALPRPC